MQKILSTENDRTQQTEELLRSLEESIIRLRQQAEDLRIRLETGEDWDQTSSIRQVASAEGLIRACQKVEICLVERQNRERGLVRGHAPIDLDTVRFEIGCRLDRLRQCCGQG
ncbi:hypothetical protein [Chachezhania sediminis]|uniref:hypothetical protein n=1 Tax=Chachezhania sediminis TaxID=2599291 RepID=UPI00131E62AE|nr:hypothetical protein [Chachezhania sediminis]